MNSKTTQNSIRLALVGAGRWGRKYIQTINDLDDVLLSHMASSNPDSSNFVDQNCKIFSHWQTLIDEGGFDGLIIATPPSSHAKIALAAIKANQPIIIEKPLTLDVAEAVTLTEAAEKYDALVLIDHIHLYNPAFRALKNIVTGWKRIDKIVSRAGNWGPFRSDTPVLWDWGAHDIAMVLDVVDHEPENISARRIGSYAVEGGKAESISIDLEWNAGLSAKVEVNNHRSEKIRRFEVQSDTEIVVYDDVSSEKLAYSFDGGSSFNPVSVISTLPLTQIVQEFAHAIRRDIRDRSDFKLGNQVVSILSKCDASLKERIV